MVKTKKGLDMTKFNMQFKTNSLLIIVLMITIFVLLILFKNKLKINIYTEKVLVFFILYLLCLIISKNMVYSLIGAILLFLVINLMINNKNFVENFENEDDNNDDENKESFDNGDDDDEDKNKEKEEFSNDDTKEFINELEAIMTPESKKASNNIKDLLKQANGGIKLTDDDVKESKALGINTDELSNDKKPNALRDAQKETYELINTVNTLKDTLMTLSPVLSEGKKLMNMFESVKL
jgi:prepilin signal peptidase PulO-like enzyme (type II secretory pathway)